MSAMNGVCSEIVWPVFVCPKRSLHFIEVQVHRYFAQVVLLKLVEGNAD